MLESLNYSFRNPKNIIWVIYRIKQLRNYKKNHGVLRGPQLHKLRWRARLGILRVNLTQHGSERSTSWPGQLIPGEQIPKCKLTWRLGGPHSQAGHFGDEKNLLLLNDKTVSWPMDGWQTLHKPTAAHISTSKMNPYKTLQNFIFVSQRNNRHVLKKKSKSAEETFLSHSTSSL